jgi:hypothetical protein
MRIIKMPDESINRYGYDIITEIIQPPMGKITHCGKVTRLVDRKKNINIPVSQFSESWGESRNDAYEKMRITVETWIAKQEP